MEPRGSSVSPLRTRERSRALGLRKTTHGSRSGRSNGWAECREKKIGIEPMGSTFFLTSPLIGHCYILNCLKPQLRSSFGKLLIAEVFTPDRILADHRRSASRWQHNDQEGCTNTCVLVGRRLTTRTATGRTI